jgi:hypothetical protein
MKYFTPVCLSLMRVRDGAHHGLTVTWSVA